MRTIAFSILIALLMSATALADQFPEWVTDFRFEQNEYFIELTVDSEKLNGNRINGFSLVSKPGFPSVPQGILHLAIPPGFFPKLSTVPIMDETVDGIDPSPLPRPVFEQDAGQTRLVDYTPYSDVEFAASGEVWPAKIASLRQVGYVRGMKVAQIVFNPLQVIKGTEQGRLWTDVTLRIGFEREKECRVPRQDSISYHDAKFYDSLVINTEDGMNWLSTSCMKTKSKSNTGCKISVDKEGLYAIGPVELSACGLGSVDPRNLAMTHMGDDVDIYVTGESDGSFDSGDAVIFWADAYSDTYTAYNDFILYEGSQPGARMALVDGAPNTGAPESEYYINEKHFEENTFYFSLVPGNAQDHWFMNYTIAPDQLEKEIFTPLIKYDAPVSAQFRSVMFGASYPDGSFFDHHTEVYLNGNLIGDTYWDGQSISDEIYNVSLALLLEFNQVQVSFPGDTGAPLDAICPDFFEITYPALYRALDQKTVVKNPEGAAKGRLNFLIDEYLSDEILVFDTADPEHPDFLENVVIDNYYDVFYSVEFEADVDGVTDRFAAYALDAIPAPAALRPVKTGSVSQNEVDLLVVYHSDFADAISSLVAFHEDRGLAVDTIEYKTVIDQYNGGRYGPDAIHTMLEDAFNNWASGGPTYVLLVGDGSYDYKDYYGEYGGDDMVSSYLVEAPYNGDTAMDQQLGCVDGDDDWPEFAIGRLPFRTVEQLENYVEKLTGYYDWGDHYWRKDIYFIADDGFESDSEGFNPLLPDGYHPQELFLTDYISDPQAMTPLIIDAFDAGSAIVNYVGHGGHDVWAHEHIFDYSNIDEDLSNEGRYAFLPTWTCLNGYFDFAESEEIIVEGMTGLAKRGAIAAFSPSRSATAYEATVIGHELYRQLFDSDTPIVGLATTAAKIYAMEQTSSFEMVGMFNLFGSPALELALPLSEDVNGSGRVDGVDLIVLSRSFDPIDGSVDYQKYADIDGNETVDTADFSLLKSAFGQVAFR